MSIKPWVVHCKDRKQCKRGGYESTMLGLNKKTLIKNGDQY